MNNKGFKEKHKEGERFRLRPGVPEADPKTILGCDQVYNIGRNCKVSVLITGAGSYIGESFKSYSMQYYSNNFTIDILDMKRSDWRFHPFKDENGRSYDIVFHVAGIAHADVENLDREMQEKYYAINTDLAIETARKAHDAGVSQFVFMSSMIVYGDVEQVTRDTIPCPANFYGDSKWQADKGVRALADEEFKVAILRPPMVYGKGSKGNYLMLSKLARRVPIFPNYKNKRSMLYIENLCEFLCQVMIKSADGVFFPQNAEYSSTSQIAREISRVVGHKVLFTKILNLAVALAKYVPGKIGNLALKAFGSSWYEDELSRYKGLDYQRVDLMESIIRTES